MEVALCLLMPQPVLEGWALGMQRTVPASVAPASMHTGLPAQPVSRGHCAGNCLNLWCPLNTADYSKIPQSGYVCIPTSQSSLLPGFLIGNKTWFLKSKNKCCRLVSFGEDSPKELGLEWLGMTFYWKKEKTKVLQSKRGYLLRTWPSIDVGCYWRFWLLLPKGKLWKMKSKDRGKRLWENQPALKFACLCPETDYIYIGEDSWESLGLQGDPTSPF